MYDGGRVSQRMWVSVNPVRDSLSLEFVVMYECELCTVVGEKTVL